MKNNSDLLLVLTGENIGMWNCEVRAGQILTSLIIRNTHEEEFGDQLGCVLTVILLFLFA